MKGRGKVGQIAYQLKDCEEEGKQLDTIADGAEQAPL